MDTRIDSEGVTVRGYVNAVERDSLPLHWRKTGKTYVERVKAGTFAKAIEKAKSIPLRFNHGWDPQVPGDIAATGAGTLTLKEDNVGLWAEAKITEPHVVERAKKGALTGWSFLFRCPAGGDVWTQGEGGTMPRRELEDIELLEVSVLDRKPAYPANSLRVEPRSEGAQDEDELEARSLWDELNITSGELKLTEPDEKAPGGGPPQEAEPRADPESGPEGKDEPKHKDEERMRKNRNVLTILGQEE